MERLKAFGESVKYFLIFSVTPLICAIIYSLLNWLLFVLKLNTLALSEYSLKIFSCILIIIIYYIISKRKQKKFIKEIKFNKINSVTAILCILLGLSICFTFEFLITIIFNYIPFLQEFLKASQYDIILPTNGIGIILLFFATGIAVPIVEEITFRSYIYSKLKEEFPKIIAFLLSSIIFVVLHGSIFAIIYVFIGCVLMTWVFDRCNSVIASILVHSVYNSSVILFNLINTDSIAMTLGVISTIVFVISLIAIYINTKTKSRN